MERGELEGVEESGGDNLAPSEHDGLLGTAIFDRPAPFLALVEMYLSGEGKVSRLTSGGRCEDQS